MSDLAELTRQIEELKQERDYLLVHSQNLETELRERGRDTARLHELQARLDDAEWRLGHVSVVSAGVWLLLRPRRALGRAYRLFRERIPWLARKRVPALERMLRRHRA